MDPTTTTTSKLPLFPRRSSKPVEIAVAPGQTVVNLKPHEVPRICVADFVPTGEPATYRAVARVQTARFRLTPDLLNRLNLGIRMDGMRRLIRAGFVQGERVTPNCYTFDLESYYEHCAIVRKATEEGTDFWSKSNLERYRTAI